MARQIGTIRTLLIAIQSLGLVLSVLFWPLTVMSVPWLVINGPSAAPLWLLVLLPIAITIPAILVPLLLGGGEARTGSGMARSGAAALLFPARECCGLDGGL
jgi:hypothetical protein